MTDRMSEKWRIKCQHILNICLNIRLDISCGVTRRKIILKPYGTEVVPTGPGSKLEPLVQVGTTLGPCWSKSTRCCSQVSYSRALLAPSLSKCCSFGLELYQSDRYGRISRCLKYHASAPSLRAGFQNPPLSFSFRKGNFLGWKFRCPKSGPSPRATPMKTLVLCCWMNCAVIDSPYQNEDLMDGQPEAEPQNGDITDTDMEEQTP